MGKGLAYLVRLILLGLCLWPTQSAQAFGGRARFSLGTDLLAYSEVSASAEDSPSSTEQGSTVAEIVSAESSDVFGVGLLPSIALGFGYTATARWIVTGEVHVSRVETTNPVLGELTEVHLMMLPGVEYLLATGSVKPYLGGQLGVAAEKQRAASDLELNTTYLVAGVKAGVHLFLGRAVSLAPAAFFRLMVGAGSARLGPFGEADLDISGFIGGVSLSLNGWI